MNGAATAPLGGVPGIALGTPRPDPPPDWRVGRRCSASAPTRRSRCTSSTTASSSRSRVRRPAIISSAGSFRSPCCSLFAALYSRAAPGLAWLARDSARRLRIRHRHRGRRTTFNAGRLSGDDYTGLAAILAGLVLVGLGVMTLWRVEARRRRPPSALCAAGTDWSSPSSVGAYMFVAPFLVSYVLTHAARAFVPTTVSARPTRT